MLKNNDTAGGMFFASVLFSSNRQRGAEESIAVQKQEPRTWHCMGQHIPPQREAIDPQRGERRQDLLLLAEGKECLRRRGTEVETATVGRTCESEK